MIREYPFIANADNGYRNFPDLENDPNVVFHGTSEEAARSIMKSGQFKPSESLSSIGFCKTSDGTFVWFLDKLGKNPTGTGNGCILAVRFDDIRALRDEPSHVYLDPGGPEPEIIGYCIVPADYRHI
jgi:hypothetical protein